MPLPFEAVRERLLRAGVTPRYSHRFVAELREHLADLAERERASGAGVEQAIERALSLMGSDADLARATLERGAPRSFAARAPWAMFVILPLVLWIAVLAVDIVSMLHFLWPVRELTPSEMPERYRALIVLGSFTASYLVGLLLVAGCIAVAARQHLASGWVWIGLTLIALLTSLIGVHAHVASPADGQNGVTAYSVVGFVYLHGRVNLPETLGSWALHAALLFGIAATAYRAVEARLSLLPQ